MQTTMASVPNILFLLTDNQRNDLARLRWQSNHPNPKHRPACRKRRPLRKRILHQSNLRRQPDELSHRRL